MTIWANSSNVPRQLTLEEVKMKCNLLDLVLWGRVNFSIYPAGPGIETESLYCSDAAKLSVIYSRIISLNLFYLLFSNWEFILP